MYQVPTSKANEIQFPKLIKIHSMHFDFSIFNSNIHRLNKSEADNNFIGKSFAGNSSWKTDYDKKMEEMMNDFRFRF